MKPKRSPDIINLEFQHLCMDNAKKSKFVELSHKERIFKLKYSWCLGKGKKKEGVTKSPTMDNQTCPSESGRKMSRGVSMHSKGHSSTKHQSTKGCHSASGSYSYNSKTPSITITSCSDESPRNSTSSDSHQSSPGWSRRNSNLSNINNSTGSTESTRNSLSPSSYLSASGFNLSLESRFSPETVYLKRMKSVEELPVRPRTSLHEMDSDGRVGYLDKLWSNVFRTDIEMPRCNSRQKGRRPKTPLKESYTNIVLGQFQDSTVSSSTQCSSTPRLPDILHKQNVSKRNCPGSEIITAEPQTITQNPVENINSRVEEKPVKEDINAAENKPTENEKVTAKDSTKTAQDTARPEDENSSDDAKDSKDADKAQDSKTQEKSVRRNTERRKSSYHVPINKPPFMTFGMRERSLSVDHEISRNLWRTGLLSLQSAHHHGKQRLISCMKLAVSKDRDRTLQGKRWRDDLKRCRYLRIPEDSPYMRPDTSDSETDS